MRVYSVGASGEILASSDLGNPIKEADAGDLLLKVRRNDKYISPVKVLKNSVPYVTIAVPVRKMGKMIGALIAEVNVQRIWDMVDKIKVGKTGGVFLVSEKGLVFAHPDKKKVLMHENFSDQEDVQSVLAGKTDARQLRLGRQHWISSYTPLVSLPGGVVLRQSQKEAYYYSHLMRLQSITVIIFAELVVFGASIVLAKALSAPLRQLVARIKQVAQGNFDERITIKRRDEIGQLIRTFNEMTEKLKRAKARERLSLIGEAASWITHEFKNSLVSLKAFAQLFPERYNDRAFVKSFSKILPEELSRWERMLRDLSDFSKHARLNVTPVRLHEIVSNACDIMEEYCLQKKVSIDRRFPAHEVVVDADGDRIKQVCMNLMINAVQAMPLGGTITVSVAITPERKNVWVTIKDTGNGIPTEELPNIFEPFHTSKRGSMGLGLAISRGIVEQHGGTILVESEVGRGTAFIVELPVKSNHADSMIAGNN